MGGADPTAAATNAARSPQDDDAVDVIVPVHANHRDTNALLASLARAKTVRRCVLTIVDDASPDPAELALPPASGSIVAVRILRNAANLGFAAAVNRAIAASRRDVVLLNSDTIVFDGWLDRLTAAAASDPRIATVTPLSNAATILSYPTVLTDHAGDLETGWGALDRLCATLASSPVEIPTGVGFCMWVRRACLDAIGPLDTAVFGAGYGEENDFCRRAAAAGWRNVAAPDTFVWHRGQGSFGARAGALRAEAHRSLLRRHPDYDRLVADHIARDPLRAVRAKLDALRIAADPRPTCLLLARPEARSRPPGCKTLRLVVEWHRLRRRWRPALDGFATLPNLAPLTRLSPAAAIDALLAETGVACVVLQRGSGVPRALAARILGMARRRGIPCETPNDTLRSDHVASGSLKMGDGTTPAATRRRPRVATPSH